MSLPIMFSPEFNKGKGIRNCSKLWGANPTFKCHMYECSRDICDAQGHLYHSGTLTVWYEVGN